MIPQLQHMECDPEECSDYALSPAMKDQAPKYPYGLCIRLTHDELAKLDLDGNCDIGDEICFTACARVTCVSKTEKQDGSQCCSIELQITDMGINSQHDEPEPQMSREDRQNTLYDHRGEY